MFGLAWTLESTSGRPAYFCGEHSLTGWRWYFPVAFAIKTPIATLALLVAVKVSLVGRLGGVAMLVSAFFWSLVLLAILVPWQYAFAESPFSGALFNYDDLYRFTREVKSSWGAVDVGMLILVFYHVRFLAYPILAVLIWLLVAMKFRRGCRRMVVSAAVPPTVQ